LRPLSTVAQGSISTILFTDLVDSTALMQRLGDERAQRVFEGHHRMLADALAASGGEELTTKIITLWDLVGLRLGDDPTRTIPLFAGLRPSQARVVVLMGEVRRFKRGEAIVRQGDTGNEMYVILDGRTEVWASDRAGHRRRVAEHKRGDVFGKMALVRHGVQRTADVVAATDVEVLAVDQRFLHRVQRRYPRIASKVFLNLTAVLSDRLERTTQHAVAATG
jgi:class 3 adenylate cyclase